MNVTVDTMVKLSKALDAELRVELVPKKNWRKAIAKTEPVLATERRLWSERERSRERNCHLQGAIAPSPDYGRTDEHFFIHWP